MSRQFFQSQYFDLHCHNITAFDVRERDRQRGVATVVAPHIFIWCVNSHGIFAYVVASLVACPIALALVGFPLYASTSAQVSCFFHIESKYKNRKPMVRVYIHQMSLNLTVDVGHRWLYRLQSFHCCVHTILLMILVWNQILKFILWLADLRLLSFNKLKLDDWIPAPFIWLTIWQYAILIVSRAYM